MKNISKNIVYLFNKVFIISKIKIVLIDYSWSKVPSRLPRTMVRKLMGVCRWSLKFGPKRIEGKWNLGPKRSNYVRIGSFNTPKDRFGVGGCEKIPQKDRVQSSECQKRGSKRRHIDITQHRGSTLPGPAIHLEFGPKLCHLPSSWCQLV